LKHSSIYKLNVHSLLTTDQNYEISTLQDDKPISLNKSQIYVIWLNEIIDSFLSICFPCSWLSLHRHSTTSKL